MCCADAFHAIRSDRPYRGGRRADDALAEIKRCSATQFDPEVVEALEQVARELRMVPASRRNGRSRLAALLMMLTLGVGSSAVAQSGLLGTAQDPQPSGGPSVDLLPDCGPSGCPSLLGVTIFDQISGNDKPDFFLAPGFIFVPGHHGHPGHFVPNHPSRDPERARHGGIAPSGSRDSDLPPSVVAPPTDTDTDTDGGGSDGGTETPHHGNKGGNGHGNGYGHARGGGKGSGGHGTGPGGNGNGHGKVKGGGGSPSGGGGGNSSGHGGGSQGSGAQGKAKKG